MSSPKESPSAPTFFVTQAEFDAAPQEERRHMIVSEDTLPLPERYTPSEENAER